jgi:hypothetical protein
MFGLPILSDCGPRGRQESRQPHRLGGRSRWRRSQHLGVSKSAVPSVRLSPVQPEGSPCLSSGDIFVLVPAGRKRTAHHPSLGPSLPVSLACQILRGLSATSLKLVLLFSLAPRPPDASSRWHRLAVLPSLAKGFIVPVASEQAVASFACTGRLPLKEQRVSLPLAR